MELEFIIMVVNFTKCIFSMLQRYCYIVCIKYIFLSINDTIITKYRLKRIIEFKKLFFTDAIDKETY